MVIALRRGMRPLDASAKELAARSATSLVPIDAAEVPREMAPLVLSINDLMGALVGRVFGPAPLPGRCGA
jgi:hypothetical protein